MAVNVGLSCSEFNVGLRAGELPTLDARFLFELDGKLIGPHDLDDLGQALKSLMKSLKGSIELVKADSENPRCFYCGKKNLAEALSCQFCGGHV